MERAAWHVEREFISSICALGGAIVTYLEITTKNGLGRRTVELRDGPLRVGRARENDIVLRDTRVSRHHCIIELVNGRPMIRDLGSSRGIKVNNRRREESDLRPGDRVRIGPFVIALRQEAGEPPTPMVKKPSHAKPSILDDWDDDLTGGNNDETATPDDHALALADDDSRDESGGDSENGSEASTGSRAGVDNEMQRRLDALTQHLARMEAALKQREQSQAAGSDKGAEELRKVIDEQRENLARVLLERDKRLESLDERIGGLLQLASRMQSLEAALHDTAAMAERTEMVEQRATDTADRLDQFATDHEQLAFEHTQVARAVQSLAGRLESIEESLQSLASLSGRFTALEEAVRSNAASARQAIERVDELVTKLDHVHELAQAAEERVTDVAVNHAESAAQVAAHEETLHHGSEQLVRLAKLLEDLGEKQKASGDERAQLSADVQSLSEQLNHMREWSDSLEQRLASASKDPNESVSAEALAVRESAWQKEREAQQRDIAGLRESIEALSTRMTNRLERLEGASADAAPELSALKEQVRRLFDPVVKEAAAARGQSESRRSTSMPSKTAVMERPAAPVKIPVPTSSGAPASIDAEQSRQVMSRIFQPKTEQDERYRPVRDRSMIVLFIFVMIVAVGVAIAMFGPMLLGGLEQTGN